MHTMLRVVMVRMHSLRFLWRIGPLIPLNHPRNNSWFLATLGARRGLTFLERQPEIDADKLGVYGHSMGGKLTVLTAGSDKRVKAAAPSCGGISDRYSTNPLHLSTVSDPPSLKKLPARLFSLVRPMIFMVGLTIWKPRLKKLKVRIGV